MYVQRSIPHEAVCKQHFSIGSASPQTEVMQHQPDGEDQKRGCSGHHDGMDLPGVAGNPQAEHHNQRNRRKK